MAMRVLSFIVWALVAASAVYWLTRLAARPIQAPPHAVTAGQSVVTANADLSRVLGATRSQAPAESAAPEPTASSRYKLVGVVAARAQPRRSGLALIAVDGKPPRPFETGGVVDGSLVLLAVNHRRAELGPAGGNATVTLELPAVPEPNRSTRTMPVPAPPPVMPAVPAQQGMPQTIPQAVPPPQPPMPGVPRQNPPESR